MGYPQSSSFSIRFSPAMAMEIPISSSPSQPSQSPWTRHLLLFQGLQEPFDHHQGHIAGGLDVWLKRCAFFKIVDLMVIS